MFGGSFTCQCSNYKNKKMKKISLTTLIMALLTVMAFGQELTQTVRGVIIDADSKLPLIGTEVVILDSYPLIGTITDGNGKFRLENIPIGRVSLKLSYLGFENQIIPNVVVNSAKEVVLNLSMQESTINMDEIVIVANTNKGGALNDMALISARSISPEETNRYAGGFNDPSRIISNFAGVTSSQDGGNDIIVRGNSPKYIQWRLEGIQITNPNHFGDQSAVGGGVSTLNNNLLATSDFHTGAFSPEYGDVLSGVYDVKLRAGNNEKFESVFGFGVLGVDLTLEGPFKKNYGGSFIVNYRYSTASIINGFGLDINGVPKFQDASFKLVLPTKKIGVFSFFGLGGKSSLFFEDVKPDFWQTPGNASFNPGISEDFDKEAYLLNTGMNHTISINKNSYLKTTLAYSVENIDDDIHEARISKIYDNEGGFVRDSILSRRVNFRSRLKKSTYRGAITYNNKFDAKNKIQIGTKYALFDYDMNQSRFQDDAETRFTLVDLKENISTVRNFISWKYRANENITIVSGIHNMNVLFNNQSTLEPRIAVNWKLNNTSSIHAGYGLHSNMESVHNYFARVEQADGTVIEPNKDLGLLKAHHYVLAYEKRFKKNLRAKIELYYQDLYDLPVENNDTSYYATINEGLEFRYVDLVNEGKGKNYGIELTLERSFDNNYYFLINTSLYQSKYKSLEGIERNSKYNGNYLVNLLVGKEFVKLGKKQNQTLGINAKAFFGGGNKVIPLLRDEQGNLAVSTDNNNYWDYEKAYENNIENVYQVTLSLSYKWNKPRTTHELFLNMDNLTNKKGKLSEFYDESEPNSIGHVTQFGLFPNLMYRLYF